MKALTKVMLWISITSVLMIAFGIYTNHYLAASSQKLESHMMQLEYKTRSEDWKDAGENLAVAKKEWEKTKKVWSMLIDHFEIDNIDATLSRVSMYIESKDKSSALAEVSVLRQYVRHIPRKESFILENIL